MRSKSRIRGADHVFRFFDIEGDEAGAITAVDLLLDEAHGETKE